MAFNSKKLNWVSTAINYAITLVLCWFLVALSNKLINDVAQWRPAPTRETFENKKLLDSMQFRLDSLSIERGFNEEERASAEHTIETIKDNYNNARASYNNWLAARKTIGNPVEDAEVLSRAKTLDKYHETEQEWRKKYNSIESEIAFLDKQIQTANTIVAKEETRAYDAIERATRIYDLNIFLIRLSFVLPILLLGIFFLIKFRKHRYASLFLGFVLFSFYTFFFGLLPYLPSYGGYVRYSVGIVLSVILGIYAINRIRLFVAMRKRVLEASAQDRAKNILTETAEKALDNHICPSCSKDFILKTWYSSNRGKNKTGPLAQITNFCRFCGLELFKTCATCGTQNFAHLPYCSHCGNAVKPLATK